MTHTVRECQCADCRGAADHPNKQLHHQMNVFVSRLDEQQRRWYVALESKKMGHGGDMLLSQITGWAVETIRRGRRELDGELLDERAKLPPVRISVRVKMTVPYVFLAIILAIAGAYLVSRIVFESMEERILNQVLIEAGKLSADRMVVEEEQRLKTLRLIANTDGIREAIAAQDADRVRELILPLAVNAHEEAIDILNTKGSSILSLHHNTGDPEEIYSATRGDELFAQWPIVQDVLQRRTEQGRDKYAGSVHAPLGTYFYVAGPLVDNANKLIGVVLVGKSLSALVQQFRVDTLAHTTVYDTDGDSLSTSFFENNQAISRLTSEQAKSILQTKDKNGFVRDLSIGSVKYSEIVGPWEVRGGDELGLIGTSLPQSFLSHTTEITRLQIFGLIASGLMLVLLIGIYVSRRLTQPLLQIVRASAQVAQGNLDVAVKPTGDDEIAVLAHAFNHMMNGLREVTERRLREIELMKIVERERELRELKTRFVSMVSHEFRTPLTTILSSSDFLKNYSQKLAPEKRQKHFERIESSVVSMKHLLEDVLLIGRTESGRLEFHPTQVELEALCRDVVDEIQMNTGTSPKIVFSCIDGSLTASVDEKLMRLVITNLLGNAIKYSPGRPFVYIDLNTIHGYFVLKVRDQGLGIPAKDQERLFEAFHRSGNIGPIPGTGLGLYITKMAVELHDGSISFESQEGFGTTFMVTIPTTRLAE
jgi:signal transduction histidine kinase